MYAGQEGATIDFDEGVSITPFNLEEEMQEGHFDSEGNYFVKKETQIRDNWLDNIDWVSKKKKKRVDFVKVFQAAQLKMSISSRR